MNNSAGKGDSLRKGANLSAYWGNYDNIFRCPRKTIAEWAAYFGDQIKSYDGFREYSCADLLTEEEYGNGLVRCTIYYSPPLEIAKKQFADDQSVEYDFIIQDGHLEKFDQLTTDNNLSPWKHS